MTLLLNAYISINKHIDMFSLLLFLVMLVCVHVRARACLCVWGSPESLRDGIIAIEFARVNVFQISNGPASLNTSWSSEVGAEYSCETRPLDLDKGEKYNIMNN